MKNYNRYKIMTKNADWRGICEMNNVNFDSFGTKKELKCLANYLGENEVVFALVSGIMRQTETSNKLDAGLNTWLVVLTSERFLFLDAALLSSSIDSQSVRLDKVQAISASQGLLLGKISIDLGSRIIVVDNCLKEGVKVMADLANRWLVAKEQGFVPIVDDLEQENEKETRDFVKPVAVEKSKVNRTAATLVTGLLGWLGLNDLIWGLWGCAAIKFILNVISSKLSDSHDILSAFILVVLCVWVIIDLFRIYEGSYFKEKIPTSPVLTSFFALIYLVIAILSVIVVGIDFFDDKKKDTGKLASIREIVETYNQNGIVAEKAFDGTRFSIVGAIRSIEKDLFGDYVVKFKGLGALNLLNIDNKIVEIELYFPENQADKLLEVRKGDIIVANCIGRGEALGIYSADKCKLLKVQRKEK